MAISALVPLSFLVLAQGSIAAQEAGATAGRAASASCAGCHGTNGVSRGGMPSLAGRSQAELGRLLLEFKSGKRPGTVMPQLAKGYNDEQIAQMSAWFAQQKPAP